MLDLAGRYPARFAQSLIWRIVLKLQFKKLQRQRFKVPVIPLLGEKLAQTRGEAGEIAGKTHAVLFCQAGFPPQPEYICSS